MKSTRAFYVYILALFLVRTDATRVSVASRFSVPAGWTLEKDPASHEPVEFTVLLKQQNLDVLDRKFNEVSDPSHPSYGKFMTLEQVNTLTSPSKEAFNSVSSWLSNFPNTKLSFGPDFIKVRANNRIASKILGAPFKTHKNSATGEVLLRAHGRITIPSHLKKYVDFVAGASELFVSSPQATFTMPNLDTKEGLSGKYAGGAKNDILITPDVLREFYKVPKELVASNPKNLQGIAAFDDFFSKGAYDQFKRNYQVPDVNITVFGEDCLPDCDEGESDLDLQYITAMGPGVDTFFVKQSASFWVLQFVTEVMTMKRIPLVFSISYGWAELGQCTIAKEVCSKLGYSAQQYVERTNTGFKKLAAMGVSVLVSDGDDGAASLGGATGNCPIDSSRYCLNGGCEHNSSKCAAISVKNSDFNGTCWVPMGLGSDACETILQDENQFNTALKQFYKSNSKCRGQLEQDSRMQYHIYSECSCDDMIPSTSDGLTISGYKFNPSEADVFVADFPASSPFITSVGATQFISKDGKNVEKEVVASISTGSTITTGGGFSKFQQMPEYQRKAVESWRQSSISSMASPSYTFNSTFRGYPDISFNGHNYAVVISTRSAPTCPCKEIPVDGTSASAPALAGLISLLNDEALNAGKTQLGFLNPLLYRMAEEYPEAFNDITEGDNKCNRAYCCKYGYEASKGWDPASGLGTPNFEQIRRYVKKIKGF
eukprot:TRINITY_DN6634_c0_g1_i1.p1 TRINITY_DN6634_c0_g1~~TRINITY_DN6634_c0_g1_i1.p1  ORF type:complete len:714 (-),score=170.80 TRINITY_DN6634_c0_g1_i1:122-2263(-)